MTIIRPPAVAGYFYPDDATALSVEVRRYLAATPPARAPAPKAIIVPHAGYIYSAPVAAPAYAALREARHQIRRVVMLGPAHRVAFHGLAAPTADGFRTPLGVVPIDREAIARIAALPQVTLRDDAHREEHALEVQLPFLQSVLTDFTPAPILVGDATADQVAEVLDILWGEAETLIVISSDLSHYYDYAAARRLDAATAESIERFDADMLDPEQACGRLPIAGLLHASRRRSLVVERLDLRNSGDTAGPRDRVVGYGSWAFREGDFRGRAREGKQAIDETDSEVSPGSPWSKDEASRLLRAAAAGLRYGARFRARPRPKLEQLAAVFHAPGASFATLRRRDALRGCIGTVEPVQPLAVDVIENAYKAAFCDPRFRPVTPEEVRGLTLSVSVLSPSRPLPFDSEDDLLRQLSPGKDGLIIQTGDRRGVFLPQVWHDIDDPARFLGQLKRKTGLERPLDPACDRASRFTTISLGAITIGGV